MSKPQGKASRNSPTFTLDDLGWKLLHELQMNGKISLAELARRCGRTTNAMIARVARMEKAGLIRGYHARVDPKALGIPYTAIIRLSVAHHHVKQLRTVLKNCAEVSEWYIEEGDPITFFIKAHLVRVERVESLVDLLAPYGTAHATIVLSSPLEAREIKRPEGS
jgi:Lrp/AsnC family leucine-responsive transcriptional regulator